MSKRLLHLSIEEAAQVADETRVGNWFQTDCWEGSCAAHAEMQFPVFVQKQPGSDPLLWLYWALLKV